MKLHEIQQALQALGVWKAINNIKVISGAQGPKGEKGDPGGGGVGGAIEIVNEIPSGLINGVNHTFTTQFNFQPNTTKLFINGIRLKHGLGEHYTETGVNQITISEPPIINDDLIMDYRKV